LLDKAEYHSYIDDGFELVTMPYYWDSERIEHPGNGVVHYGSPGVRASPEGILSATLLHREQATYLTKGLKI
jgi:hypothetical protein